MSILIKGMEMPTSCFECRFSIDGFCYASGHVNIRANEERQITNYCPLVPVPPHGRLIDADELASPWNWLDDDGYPREQIIDRVNDAPTIIPAEREK